MPSKDVAKMTIHLTVEGKPECCRKLREAGWKFDYCPVTRFVSARHPLGGVQSVVEVYHVSRTTFDADEIGRQIAMLLNGGNVERIEFEPVTRLVARCEANEVSFDNADMSTALSFGQAWAAEASRLRSRLEFVLGFDGLDDLVRDVITKALDGR